MKELLTKNTFINITNNNNMDTTLALVEYYKINHYLYNSIKGFYKTSIQFTGDSNTSIIGELKRISNNKVKGNILYIINSYYLEEANITRVADALQMLFANFFAEEKHLVVIGNISFLPKDIQDLFVKVSMSLDIEKYKKHLINQLAKEFNISISYTDIDELKLLSSQQIYNVFINSKNPADLKTQREKMLLFNLLEKLNNDISFSHIGSWGDVKRFIRDTLKPLLKLENVEIPLPTNILLSGVSGNGKTTMAKAIANELGYNIYKVDTGILYNKYLGNTEKNMRLLWEEIKRVSPAVILFDELEKILAGVSSSDSVDAGTTARLLSYVLTQLQDHNTKSIIIGTINNKENVPPELLRVGRWDLKCEQAVNSKYVKTVIFALLKKYKIIKKDITVDWINQIFFKIIKGTNYKTGAEIEYLFKNVLYKLLIKKSEINFNNFMEVLNEQETA